MKRSFAFLGRFLADQWRQFTPTGQLLFVLGVGAIIVDATIAAKYGMTAFESLGHAAGFALVAIACALMPDIAAREFERKAWTSGAIIVAICVPLFGVAYQSHVGYGAGVRLGDMQAADIALSKVSDVRASLTSEQTNIQMLRDIRASKIEDRKKLVSERGWSPTVTADQLRAERNDEAKKGGCGTRCKQIEAKIDAAEIGQKLDAEIAGYDKQIADIQRVIDNKTQVAIETKPKASAVVFQNAALGDLLKLGGFDFDNRQVNLAATGNTALAFLLLAPLFMFAAGRNRLPQYSGKDEPPTAAAPVTEPTTPVEIHEPAPMQTVIRPAPQMIGTAILTRIANTR